MILGLNCYKHDAAAAVVVDGAIVAAAEEERFVRRKHTGEFPAEAARYCLAAAGARAVDVDYVAFYMDPAKLLARLGTVGLRQLLRSRDGQSFAQVAPVILKNYFLMKEVPKRLQALELAGERATVHYVPHHLAHAAAAFFPSPFERAAIMSLDGAGEWTSGLLAVGAGNRVEVIREHFLPASLGQFYLALTRYLGFPHHGDEYKVMGLASYGEDAFREEFARILGPDVGGRYRFDASYFYPYYDAAGALHSRRFEEVFGPPRSAREPLAKRHRDIAASGQEALNRVALALAEFLREETGARFLCLAGGVALNCVMNQRLMQSGLFEGLFVQPAAHDAGSALGAALYVYHQLLGKPRTTCLTHVYLGPEYDDRAVEDLLQSYGLPYSRPADIAATAADAVAAGAVVGWFQGRMEFGPRALGNRSILADARRPEVKDRVNATIKRREPFRPFAPAVRAERVGDYFSPARESPFMTVTFDATPLAKEEIPAVVHVDGTSRIQTVRRDENPLFYRFLKAYERLTGVGAVLNTSFNVAGEPIVCTPDDALRSFYTTALDALALGPFWLVKK